ILRKCMPIVNMLIGHCMGEKRINRQVRQESLNEKNPKSQIPNHKFQNPNPKSQSQNSKFKIQNFKSQIAKPISAKLPPVSFLLPPFSCLLFSASASFLVLEE
ncbi:MAG TPA: hypothetical protein PK464_00975, partial [Candidatus Marinimicrobia bacterium]|nr:hypothetical protein [Candidatus Neomarinimicrobiota bacterium]